MKKMTILIAVIVCWGKASYGAGCPSGFEEIPLENIRVTTGDETCTTSPDITANFEKYYEINAQCTAHILD